MLSQMRSEPVSNALLSPVSVRPAEVGGRSACTYSCMAKAEAKTVESMVMLLRKMVLQSKSVPARGWRCGKGGLLVEEGLELRGSVSIASWGVRGVNWLTPAIVKVLRARAGGGRGRLGGLAGDVVGEEARFRDSCRPIAAALIGPPASAFAQHNADRRPPPADPSSSTTRTPRALLMLNRLFLPLLPHSGPPHAQSRVLVSSVEPARSVRAIPRNSARPAPGP
jgi:hypothetical protein